MNSLKGVCRSLLCTYGLQANTTTSIIMWTKSNVKPTLLLICPRYLSRNLAQKMLIFSFRILKNMFFTRILGGFFKKN